MKISKFLLTVFAVFAVVLSVPANEPRTAEDILDECKCADCVKKAKQLDELLEVDYDYKCKCEDCVEKAQRPTIVTRIARDASVYFANLLVDLVDLVSMEVSFGNTVALDVHATRFFDFGFENTDAYFAAFGPVHRFGVGRREAQRAAALCWSYDDVYVSQTSGNNIPGYTLKDASFNLVRCYSNAYTDVDDDYLAIGFRAAMFAGIAFDLHLGAIPDFLVGLSSFDLSGDNWTYSDFYEDPKYSFIYSK